MHLIIETKEEDCETIKLIILQHTKKLRKQGHLMQIFNNFKNIIIS